MTNGDKQRAMQSPFGRLLRFWRETFETSQEALALDLGSSSRHISRMENGLVQPSRDMVLRIGGHFGLGERDTKQLLFAAGYTAIAREADLWAPDMRWLRRSMAQLVTALAPAPAFLTSGGAWILMVNRSWLEILRPRLPGDAGDATRVSAIHYYEALTEGAALAGQDANWRPTLVGILMSLQQEAIMRDDDDLQAVVDDLARRRSDPTDWRIEAVPIDPMGSFPVWLEQDGVARRYNQVSMSLGQRGPTTFIAEPRLRLTTLLPMDAPPASSAPVGDGAAFRMLSESILAES